MIKMNKFKIQRTLLLLAFCGVLVSCSKEEDETKATPFSSPTYDEGNVSVVFNNIPNIIDSILYFNHTRGTSTSINVSELIFYNNPSPYSVLNKAIASGKTNDQVECCVYFNTPLNIFISFNGDSTTSTFTNLSPFCQTGTY